MFGWHRGHNIFMFIIKDRNNRKIKISDYNAKKSVKRQLYFLEWNIKMAYFC